MGHVGLVYVGAGLATAWGLGHAALLPSIEQGFQPLTDDNRRLLRMVWIALSMTLVFVGCLAALAASSAVAGNRTGRLVCGACAAMLIANAVWTRVTGSRARSSAMRLCPLVLTAAAALIWLGTWS
jgi:hypothetical protein